jgi:hypothetical protein
VEAYGRSPPVNQIGFGSAKKMYISFNRTAHLVEFEDAWNDIKWPPEKLTVLKDDVLAGPSQRERAVRKTQQKCLVSGNPSLRQDRIVSQA